MQLFEYAHGIYWTGSLLFPKMQTEVFWISFEKVQAMHETHYDFNLALMCDKIKLHHAV